MANMGQIRQKRRALFKTIVVLVGGGSIVALVDRVLNLSNENRPFSDISPPIIQPDKPITPDLLELLHERLTDSLWPPGTVTPNGSIGFYEYTRHVNTSLGGFFNVPTYTHCIHSLGFRIPADSDQASYERGGIMAGGCSFTYGPGLDSEGTLPHHLGRALDLPSYNYGGCSYSLLTALNQLEFLEEKGIVGQLSPRYYLLGSGHWLFNRTLNPFYPTYGLQYKFPHLDKVDGQLVEIVPSLEDQIGTAIDFQRDYFEGRIGDEELLLTEERRVLLKPIVNRVREILQEKEEFKVPQISEEELSDYFVHRFKEICDRNDMELVIAHFSPGSDYFDKDEPAKSRFNRSVGFEYYNELGPNLQVVARRNGIRIVDGSEIWGKYGINQKAEGYLPDGHPSGSQNEALARLVADTIANR